MREKVRELAHDRLCLTRHEPFEQMSERIEQFPLSDEFRQHDHDQDQQRDDRQQRVVRHRARQQHALVRAKGLQRA